MKVSYIFPIYNQADHIRPVIEKFHAAVSSSQIDFEFLLVVNGSRDESLQVCESMAKKLPELRVFELEKGGWGRAVLFGIKQSRGELICFTNTARTDARDLVLVTLYARIYPEVVVKAERKFRDSWLRRLGSLLYNLQVRLLFDLAHWDINGTPKIFSRQHAHLLNLSSENDLVDAEFLACCRREGYAVISVPINGSSRHGGKSTTNFLSAFRMYEGVFRLWSRLKTGRS